MAIGLPNLSLGGGSSFSAGGSLMGINADQIPTIQTSIDEYLRGVDTILEGINAESVNVSQAFKGTAQVATITSFLEESIQTIKKVTVELQKFSTDLDTIKASYVSEDSAITAQAISDDGLTVDTGVNGFSN